MAKVCLIVIDGWGVSQEGQENGDAIKNANTPVMDHLTSQYPYTTLLAHGLAVGLPKDLMGNSEVGHLNIGAGRIVYQDIVRIDQALDRNEFAQIPNIKGTFARARSGNGRLHFLGLVSDGGVHSHIRHLFGLIKAAKGEDVPEVFVHFFSDGRDTDPKSAITYLQQLNDFLQELNYGSIATIIGRYYAMDRDKRWERIAVACKGLINAVGEDTSDPIETVRQRYTNGETDEFLKPIIVDKHGQIKDGDTLFFIDFRADRMRQIVQTFGIRPSPINIVIPKDLHITTMTQYKADFPFDVVFPPQTMDNVLSAWLAKQKMPQCHVAETEKYAHVTFFFNGGTEARFDLEDRELIPSPKVATYDLEPKVSVELVAEKVVEAIGVNKYHFVMCNFAPPDMVGHTGVYEAAVKGIEATDCAIGMVYEVCKKHGYTLFVTADHGNAEKMLGEDGGPHTAHTTSPVPFIMASTYHKFSDRKEAALCDVAPTILGVMDIPVPTEMTGQSLLAK